MKKLIALWCCLLTFYAYAIPEGEAEPVKTEHDTSSEKEEQEKSKEAKIASEKDSTQQQGSKKQSPTTTVDHVVDSGGDKEGDGGLDLSSPDTSSKKEAEKSKKEPAKKVATSQADVPSSDFVSSAKENVTKKQETTTQQLESIKQQREALKKEIEKKPWHKKIIDWFLKLFKLVDDPDKGLKKDQKAQERQLTSIQEQFRFLDRVQNELTEEQLSDPETQQIIQEYLKLPYQAYPDNIADALERMQRGQQVRNAINKGNFDNIEEIKSIKKKLTPDHQKIFEKLLTNKPVTPEELESLRQSEHIKEIKQAYLRTIVDLQWDVYKQAMLEKSGFASGMVTIPDAQENVMNFMENYVKLVNPDYDASGVSLKSLTNKEGYSRSGRVSSHWKGRVTDQRIYGIDVRSADGSYVKDLPGNKQQLHFGRLDNGTTFIKWEYHGTTLAADDASLLSHALDYKRTQEMKKTGANKSEVFRKEHVLEETQTAFKEALGDVELSKEQEKAVKQKGIAEMVKILEEQITSASSLKERASAAEKLGTFKDHLSSLGYDPNTLHLRKGNEVLLSSGLFTTTSKLS